MKKQTAIHLKETAELAAKRFSNPDRAKNHTSEEFKVEKIIPLSEYTAAVFMMKNTGKVGVFFFYWINVGKSGKWCYFVPTDSHILGMTNFKKYKDIAEIENFDKN